MAIEASDQMAIEAAFSAAQSRTDAPIVCVLARASGRYEVEPIAAGALLGLLAPWPLLILTDLSAQRIFLVQLLVCLAASALLAVTPLRLLLTPRRERRANAHRAALAQFQLRALDRVAGRASVLVYVSLAERYARVVAAEAATHAIAQSQWQGFVDALVADIGRRGAAEALASAAPKCADLLAAPFPPVSGAPRPRQHFHVI